MLSFHVIVLASLSRSTVAVLFPMELGVYSHGLETRQISPEGRECHADCGYTILDAALPDHCTNSTWTGLFDNCLDCALEYDIWKDYGNGVTQAAEGCGLDATPDQPEAASSVSPPSTTTTVFANATLTGSAAISSTTASRTSTPDSTASTTGALPSNTVSN